MRISGVTSTWLLLLFLLMAWCKGLELDLDLDPREQIGARPLCAILRCVEEGEPSTAATSSLDQPRTSISKNITSLTLFQNPQSCPPGKDGGSPGAVLASVTSHQARLTRVSNGIKAEGSLDSQRASLTVELRKSRDCLAGFTCELRTVDVNGVESVSVARLRQGQTEVYRRSFAPSVSLQILDLAHQLDLKLTTTSKTSDELKNKMESLEDKLETLESRMLVGENNLNTKLDLVRTTSAHFESRLEDKVAFLERDLQANIATLQNRIEDKLEAGLVDKLREIHTEVMEFTSSAKTYSDDVEKSLNKSFKALSQHLKDAQEEAVNSLHFDSQTVFVRQNNATENLIMAAEHLLDTQSALQTQLLDCLSTSVDGLSETGANVSKTLAENFASVQNQLGESFHQLALRVNRSSLETLNSANDRALQTTSSKVVTALEALLSPKRCTRGMLTVSSSASYPYPLIQPSRDGASLVDVPFLCDTVTDGGGWVIIQRRSSGDVDFHRGWEEYKNGFGDPRGDFYLGNENIHKITNSGPFELRVEMMYGGRSAYAQYRHFSVAGEELHYRLNVTGYSGTAGESLIKYDNGKPFTTLDRDNDNGRLRNCAERCSGAWWYDDCGHSNLNGKWNGQDYHGPFWVAFSGSHPVTYSEMKVRSTSVS